MLRVLAVSAPHWQFHPGGEEQHLNSSTPFSLQNAIRVCTHEATQGIGVWGNSNWNSAEGLESAVFMSDYLHETFYSTALTMSSMTFLASPNTIIVLSR